MRPTRPQIPYVVTFKCGHSSGRKTRIDTPGYIAGKQRAASLTLCPACQRAEEERLRARREEKAHEKESAFLARFPQTLTDLERFVSLEAGLYNATVTAYILRRPVDLTAWEIHNYPETSAEEDEFQDEILEETTLRPRSCETVVRQLQEKYPDGHIFITTSRTDEVNFII